MSVETLENVLILKYPCPFIFVNKVKIWLNFNCLEIKMNWLIFLVVFGKVFVKLI